MSTFLEALQSAARRWAMFAARATRIARWRLPRCNAFIGDEKSSAAEHYVICNRVKGHARDQDDTSGCCGNEGRCGLSEHDDVCKCVSPKIVSEYHGRCECGGFPLEATQPPGVA